MLNKKNSDKLALANQTNAIMEGTTIEGSIKTSGSIRIDGLVKGNIDCENKIVLGQTAKIDGNINAKNIDVEGYVKGNLSIEDTLALKATAKIDGDIKSMGSIIVEKGGTFNGNCKMGQVSQSGSLGKISKFSNNKAVAN